MNEELLYDYIKAIENPDRIGWNEKRQIWEAPKLKGYDKNQRGYGIDTTTNKKAVKLTAGRSGKWITDKEMNDLMKDHIDYVLGVARRRIEGFDSFSPEKQAVTIGMMYRGDKPLSVAKRGLINFKDDDRKFIDSVANYYSRVGVGERGRSTKKFFDNYYAQQQQKPTDDNERLLASTTTPEVPVSTRVERVSINSPIDMTMVPKGDSYVEAERITPNEKLRKALYGLPEYLGILSRTSIPSTATPSFVPDSGLSFKRGGKLISRKLINKLR